MKILGVDPGYGRLGWGVIDEERLIDYGCLTTVISMPDEQRLNLLFQWLLQLIRKWRPETVAVEKIFFFKNQKTVVPVAESRGMVLLAAAQSKLPVFSYTPLQIKQAVTGYGRAEKAQVQQMVKAILKLKSIPKSDDAADALAVALAHAFSYKFKSRVK